MWIKKPVSRLCSTMTLGATNGQLNVALLSWRQDGRRGTETGTSVLPSPRLFERVLCCNMFNLDFLFLKSVELPLYEYVNVYASFPIAYYFHGGRSLWFPESTRQAKEVDQQY
jgi:hypothetical protein